MRGGRKIPRRERIKRHNERQRLYGMRQRARRGLNRSVRVAKKSRDESRRAFREMFSLPFWRRLFRWVTSFRKRRQLRIREERTLKQAYQWVAREYATKNWHRARTN